MERGREGVGREGVGREGREGERGGERGREGERLTVKIDGAISRQTIPAMFVELPPAERNIAR